MPRIALLSDIHANDHALIAVLDEIHMHRIDQIIICGDIVGYGAKPMECVKLVRALGVPVVLGNHDQYTVFARQLPDFLPTHPESFSNPVWAGIRLANAALDGDSIEWLASLPRTIAIPGATVAHAALHDDVRWPYLLDDRDAKPTLDILAHRESGVGFFGHTHRQEWFMLPRKSKPKEIGPDHYQIPQATACAVVVGSVGQPRSGDHRAGWTIWDSDEWTFQFMRTEYPAQMSAHDILDAGLPESSARRLLPFP
jgi:predicted phosphodiesterase